MIERSLVIDYEMVRGLPGNVEERVKHLIERCDGWQPKGDPQIIKIDNCDLIMQCMVQYENNNND